MSHNFARVSYNQEIYLDLVKHGLSSCSIEIHLSNDGLDAYMPETYGEKIIVVRNITASGSSSYKLKNENGNVIASTRQELEKMMICMNIQVENPIVVLNQDCARSFLKDCDPKKLFKLFMQATQLEMIIQKLDECHGYFVNGEHHLKLKQKQLQVCKADLQKRQERFEELQSVVGLKETLVELKRELAWLAVSEQERELKSKENTLNNIAKKINDMLAIIRNKDNLDAQINQKLQQYNDIIAEKQRYLGTEQQAFEEVS